MINSKRYQPEGFSTEAQGKLKYLAFATLAEKEGFPQIAALFRATVQAETGQARIPFGEKMDFSPYQETLARLAEGAQGDYYVCSKCGSVYPWSRPEKCARCRSEALNFVKIG